MDKENLIKEPKTFTEAEFKELQSKLNCKVKTNVQNQSVTKPIV